VLSLLKPAFGVGIGVGVLMGVGFGVGFTVGLGWRLGEGLGEGIIASGTVVEGNGDTSGEACMLVDATDACTVVASPRTLPGLSVLGKALPTRIRKNATSAKPSLDFFEWKFI